LQHKLKIQTEEEVVRLLEFFFKQEKKELKTFTLEINIKKGENEEEEVGKASRSLSI